MGRNLFVVFDVDSRRESVELTLLAVSPCSVGPNVDRSLKSWVDLKGNLGEKFGFLGKWLASGKMAIDADFRLKLGEVLGGKLRLWISLLGVYLSYWRLRGAGR
jgi:hypothetical protein